MNFYVQLSLSLTIGIAAVMAWWKHPRTEAVYMPFFWLLWTGFFIEMISIQIILMGKSNVVLYNIFSIIEVLLINWFFFRMGLLVRKHYYHMVQAVFAVWWTVESFFINSLNTFNSYFFIGSSFAIVFMSIHEISKIAFKGHQLFFNARFLVCLGLMIYFSYSILVEAFWIFGLNQTPFFRTAVLDILTYVNAFINLLFAAAILWMPTKQKYIVQY